MPRAEMGAASAQLQDRATVLQLSGRALLKTSNGRPFSNWRSGCSCGHSRLSSACTANRVVGNPTWHALVELAQRVLVRPQLRLQRLHGGPSAHEHLHSMGQRQRA